jgi:hypothetical protein
MLRESPPTCRQEPLLYGNVKSLDIVTICVLVMILKDWIFNFKSIAMLQNLSESSLRRHTTSSPVQSEDSVYLNGVCPHANM